MHFGFPVCRAVVAFGVAAFVAGCGGGGGGGSLQEGGATQTGDTVSTTRTVEGLRFTATSRAVYSTTEPVTVTLTVENTTGTPISYVKPNCGNGLPRAAVRNENGEVVTTISAVGGSGQGCAGPPAPSTFSPGQTQTYTLIWTQPDYSPAKSDGSVPPLPAGTYRINPTVPFFSIGGRQFLTADPAPGPDPLTVTVR